MKGLRHDKNNGLICNTGVGRRQEARGALEGGLLDSCRQLGPAHVLHFIYGLHAEAL